MLKKYIPHADLRLVINQPFRKATSTVARATIAQANAAGGGYAGQSGAIRHGIAQPFFSSRPRLPRFIGTCRTSTRTQCQRKKPGLKKARKASHLVNVNSKELLYLYRAPFQKFFLYLLSIGTDTKLLGDFILFENLSKPRQLYLQPQTVF